MKIPEPPLPPISNWWDTVVASLRNEAVDHWWIFLIVALIVGIVIAPKK